MRTSGTRASASMRPACEDAMARSHWASTRATVASSSNATRTSIRPSIEPSLGSAGAAAPLGGLSYTRAVKSWRSVYRRSRSIAAARVQVRPSNASWSGRAGRPCVRICTEGEGEARGEHAGADVSRKRRGAVKSPKRAAARKSRPASPSRARTSPDASDDTHRSLGYRILVARDRRRPDSPRRRPLLPRHADWHPPSFSQPISGPGFRRLASSANHGRVVPAREG